MKFWRITLRLTGLLICCLIFNFVAGCSTPKVPKYPADHARFERIVEAVESLRQAYVQKDLAGVRDRFLPLDVLDQLGQDIRRDFDTYSDITLELSIERVTIRGDQILVNVRWQGEWKKEGQVVGALRRGHGILRWTGSQVVLLAGIEGDLPFGMAAREALS